MGDKYVIVYRDGTSSPPGRRGLSDTMLGIGRMAHEPFRPAYRIRIREKGHCPPAEAYTRRNAEDIHD